MHVFFHLIFYMTEYSIVPVTMLLLMTGDRRKIAPLALWAEILFITAASLVRAELIPLPFSRADLSWLGPTDLLQHYFFVVYVVITYTLIKISFEINWVNGVFCVLVGYCAHELYMGILCLIIGEFAVPEPVDAIMRPVLAAVIVMLGFRIYRKKIAENNIDILKKRHKHEIICLVVCLVALFGITIMSTIATVSYFQLAPAYSSMTTSMRELAHFTANQNMLKGIIESVVVLLALHTMLQYGESDFEHELFFKLYEQEKAQYRQFQQSVDYINSRYHDLKHCLTLLSKDRDSAEQLLNDVNDNIDFLKTEIDTGNETLNSIVTDRQMLCHNNDIEFHFMTDGTDFHWIDSVDLYIIFCNILDNAIEYLQGFSDEKMIRLGIRSVRQMVFIHQENRMIGNLRMDGLYPVSTKGNAHNHGFGLKSIAATVERYGGTMSVNTEEGKYELNIFIPKPKT